MTLPPRHMTPDVTVVVPTKDRGPLLKETLRSIRGQRNAALKVVVVDDGSRDPLLVPAAVAELGDGRFAVVRHDLPLGVSAARNRGITEARTPWVAFCDDDDLWAPDKLASQLAVISAAVDWVYVGSVNITQARRVVGGAPPPSPATIAAKLSESNVVPGGASSVMARRETLLHAGGFDTSLQPLADWDLWLRLLDGGLPAGVAQPLVAYRVHAANMSLDTKRVEADFAVIARRYPAANAAVLLRYLGWWSLRVRRHRDAGRYFLRAAAARDPRYPTSLLRADLAYLLRDVAEEVRQRRASGIVRRPLHRPGRMEHMAWREQGRRWIDSL